MNYSSIRNVADDIFQFYSRLARCHIYSNFCYSYCSFNSIVDQPITFVSPNVSICGIFQFYSRLALYKMHTNKRVTITFNSIVDQHNAAINTNLQTLIHFQFYSRLAWLRVEGGAPQALRAFNSIVDQQSLLVLKSRLNFVAFNSIVDQQGFYIYTGVFELQIFQFYSRLAQLPR